MSDCAVDSSDTLIYKDGTAILDTPKQTNYNSDGKEDNGSVANMRTENMVQYFQAIVDVLVVEHNSRRVQRIIDFG